MFFLYVLLYVFIFIHIIYNFCNDDEKYMSVCYIQFLRSFFIISLLLANLYLEMVNFFSLLVNRKEEERKIIGCQFVNKRSKIY